MQLTNTCNVGVGTDININIGISPTDSLMCILKNLRVKDQRETVLIFALQNRFCDHSAISGIIALYVGRTELGYVAPDAKIVTTRVIKWRRSTSEPDEEAL